MIYYAEVNTLQFGGSKDGEGNSSPMCPSTAMREFVREPRPSAFGRTRLEVKHAFHPPKEPLDHVISLIGR